MRRDRLFCLGAERGFAMDSDLFDGGKNIGYLGFLVLTGMVHERRVSCSGETKGYRDRCIRLVFLLFDLSHMLCLSLV